MKHGLQDGFVIVRNSNGDILDEAKFVEGTGIHRIFSTDGRLGWEIPHRNGKPQGTKRHYIKGAIVEEKLYRDGTLVTDD